MQRWFFEAMTDFNWGKFMVARFDGDDLNYKSRTDTEFPVSLIRSQGWGSEHMLVVDLTTGEGAIFAVRPNGFPHADLEKHRIWVCVLFEAFLEWLYQQDVSDMDALPSVVQLAVAPAMQGYRRPGPAET